MDKTDRIKSRDIPEGFLLSVTEAGIKYSDRTDMALIYSERDAVTAGTFTGNKVKAAPVLLDIKKVRSRDGRAIIINSGNANACTGRKGMKDAEQICRKVADGLSLSEKKVLISSTGVIGLPLPMKQINAGINNLLSGLGDAGAEDVARAIMTTDSFPKFISRRFRIGRVDASITAIAKGAGMISPGMATMLCFILTDLAVEKRTLQMLLKETVDKTYNLITVDGDMSTNDTVLMMANGAAGNTSLTNESRGFNKFSKVLFEVTDELSRMIVRDGEGATKLVSIRVRGAKNESDAKRAAMSVATSPLVKTAIYGRDANWGRIISAVGYSGAFMKEGLIDISINGVKIVSKGLGTGRDDEASKAMKHDTVSIEINLKLGSSSVRVYTCDFTEEYIKINAEYRT